MSDAARGPPHFRVVATTMACCPSAAARMDLDTDERLDYAVADDARSESSEHS